MPSLDSDVAGLTASATLAIQERSAALVASGRKIYRLGFGQSPFPVPERVVAELRHHAERKEYLPVRGLAELRQAVAEHHHREDEIDAAPEGVLIGPGSKELMFLLQLVFRGTILIPSPSWVSYAPQAQILGRPTREVATTFGDGWKVTPKALAESAAASTGPHLLILNYPNNPVGNTYDADELAALANVARQHGILILSDEIYGRLNFTGKHVSIARFYPEGTIVSSGLSKWCGAGGWRLGTFVVPPPLAALSDAMAAVASETFSAVSAPIQYAAVTAFRGGPDIENFLCDSRRLLGALGNRCAKVLSAIDVDVRVPEGGFYLFPDFSRFADKLAKRGLHDSPSLCEQLLQDTGVATLPGVPFGRPASELTARLAFVDFDGGSASSALEDGGDVSDDFLEQHCSEVVTAMHRIADWLSS